MQNIAEGTKSFILMKLPIMADTYKITISDIIIIDGMLLRFIDILISRVFSATERLDVFERIGHMSLSFCHIIGVVKCLIILTQIFESLFQQGHRLLHLFAY